MMSFQKIYSPTQLANAMKLVRQQNGWTQSELAKKIGIKQATISNFENNPDNTTLTTFFKILQSLELSMTLCDAKNASPESTEQQNLELTAYKADIPLGMIREENDFRISVAGAQEKTALLRIGNDWCIPKGITPTTHIIKLPIGEIRQPNATLDLSQSVDNEYYCLLLAKELGLNVPDAEIIKAGNVRALAVERFDRRWNAERTVLLRLPQEDMCQTFGLPSSVKYESDGGPGIARIMAFLMGSSEALKDRYDFMKFQVFQWLIGATDGHAKNFSVFIQAGGSYRLTPFYDIISAFPVLGGTGIHISDLKLAMGLNASKGKKTAIDKIYPRHFLATAKVLRFPEVQMHEILSDFARMIPAALDNVKTSLPTDFPENVVTAVESNVLRLHGRLSREYGSK